MTAADPLLEAGIGQFIGRSRELGESPSWSQPLARVKGPIVLAVAAEYRLAAGDPDSARIYFSRLVPTLAGLPRNIQQAAVIAISGELAATFGDHETVAACDRRLRPYERVYQASSNGYRGAYARPLAAVGGMRLG